jgi:hypothetical protein
MFIRRNERILISNNSARQNYPMKKSTNSARPAFWNQRYASGETPWVLHKIPAILRSFLTRTRRKGRVLIPGCGTDHGVIKFLLMADSKLPPLTFHRLSLLKRRKRSGILTAKLCAQIFANPISEGALILSTNGRFSARCIRGDGRYTPNASLNYSDPAENLSASFLRNRAGAATLSDQQNTGGKKNRRKYFRLLRDLKVSDSVPMFAGMERWQEWERAAMK